MREVAAQLGDLGVDPAPVGLDLGLTGAAATDAVTAGGTTNVTPINPTGVGSKWCGATGIAKLSFDLTAMTNLK